jgi:amino acid transporter
MACVNAASRMIFSMGRYRFIHPAMGRVHRHHRTPHVAVAISTCIIAAVTLAVTPLGLLIAIVSPVDLHRAGLMRRRDAAIGAIGAAAMAFVVFGSLYPVPPYPYSLLPYLFAAYMLVGAAWFGWLRRSAPTMLIAMEQDMEEAGAP